MARPRAFDTDRALDGAMDVFWDKGFEAASLTELLTGMGIARGSLYKAFSDKKSLFLMILDRYRHHAVLPAVGLLSDTSEPDGMARIQTLFDSVIAAVRAGDRRGCLICSAAAGPASEDPDIAKTVGDLLGEMRAGFQTALAASEAYREAAPETQAALAHTLETLYVGLRILTRADVPADHLAESVTALMQLLASGETVSHAKPPNH